MESLRDLLADAIDYAGVFPPANLSLTESAARYARYLSDSDSWMLARFVCPAHRLHELLLPRDSSWRFAVIGRAAESAEQFWTDVSDELAQIAAFRKTQRAEARFELFEVPLPKSIATRSEPAELESFVAESADRVATGAPELSAVLFEPLLLEHWQPQVSAITTALAAVNQQLTSDSKSLRVGLKLRMGGATATACPTSEQIASLIAACRDAQLCFKATAGLHQPLRHVEPATGSRAHGFVNLLSATVLAATHCLSAVQIEKVLDDDHASSFVFRDDGFSWRRWRASTEQIQQVRTKSLLSFGSCSFDEPREGLCQLGWLQRVSR